ncbi:MAG: exosortase/archaeosortase family protein [Sedimentisphaerales bacterium]
MVENISLPAAKQPDSPGSPKADTPEQSWRRLGVHSYIRMAIIGGLLFWLFNREVWGIVYTWFTDSSWSHGILIPLFSLYFLNQTKNEILNASFKPNYLGLVLLVCVLLFYIFNIVSPAGYGYFRQLAVVGALGAVVLFLGGWRLLKWTWLPVAYLFFAVPLPEGYLRLATIPMRQWAAAGATVMLNLVPQVEATTSGVIIDIVYKGQHLEPGLDVAEACSGMRLLMAFFALGVAMAYLHYRPVWQRLVLLASTIPIAILCNIIRVMITGFIYVLGDPEYAQGIYHDLLGMAMLPLAFGLYGALAWFMSNLFVESEQRQTPDIIVARTRTDTDRNTD